MRITLLLLLPTYLLCQERQSSSSEGELVLPRLFQDYNQRGRQNSSKEGELVTRLLQGYSRKGRPVNDVCMDGHTMFLICFIQTNDTLSVTVSLTLQQILSLDDEEESLTAIYWFNIAWNDFFLRWDEEESQVSSNSGMILPCV